MADLTIDPTDVQAGSAATVFRGVAGEDGIAAGDSVYLKVGDGKLWKALSFSAAEADAVGIAVNSAETDQPLAYVSHGEITLSPVLTPAEIYVVGGSGGGIAPEGDNSSGEYVTVLGIATTSAILKMNGVLAGGVGV